MSIRATDVENARQVIADAGAIRIEIEGQLIRAGAWPASAVDDLIERDGDTITMGDDLKITGIEAAVDRYRQEHPDAFVALSRAATNPKKTPMERFQLSYREIMKTRGRKADMESLTKRALGGMKGYPRASNLGGAYAGPRASRRAGIS